MEEMDPGASLVSPQDPLFDGSYNITEMVIETIISTVAPNITNSTRRRGGPFRMSVGADIGWTVIFSVMIVGAIIGNIVVFWIVLCHRRMQNVTNYFLVNLSFADLMMSCLNTIFNFIFMKNRDWVFGSFYCTINNFIAYLSVAVSVFTLMAISIDRYIAIVRPLKPRMSKTCARFFLLFIWLSSILLSLPAILYSSTWTFAYSEGGNLTVCFLLWPDGPPTVSKLDYIYNIVYFILTYIVPIVAMGICYGQIGAVLWGKSIIRENACNDLAHERKLRSKRKVVKMFMVVVFIFAVCWLPYHVYFIYTYHHKEVVTMPFIQHVYLAFYWLAMANSMFNPFVYYWMNARFRGYFKAVLSSIHMLCCDPARLLFRSHSASSLDIGVVPIDRRRGVVRMEMHHFQNQNRKRVLGTRAQLFIEPSIRNGRSERDLALPVAPNNTLASATPHVSIGPDLDQRLPSGSKKNDSSVRNSNEFATFGMVLVGTPGNKSSSGRTSRNSHSHANGCSINLDVKTGGCVYSNGASPTTEGSSLLPGNYAHSKSVVAIGSVKWTNATGSDSGLIRHENGNGRSLDLNSGMNKSSPFLDHDEPVLRFSVPFRNNPLLKELK